MIQRGKLLFQVTPRVHRTAGLVALGLLGLAVFVTPIQTLLWITLVLIAFPGALGAAVRLLGAPVFLSTTASLAWLWIFGTYSPVRDACLLIAIILADLLAWPSWRRWWSAGCDGACPLFAGPRGFFAGIIAFVAFWGASSTMDVVERRQQFPVPDIGRFQKSTRMPLLSDRSVALALSGGGYRAALVHAGVLFGLENLGVHITGLSAVSGGSITASYYVAGGDPLQFLKIVQQKHLGLPRELTRFHVFPRLLFASAVRLPLTSIRLFPGTHFGRVGAQAELLDRLFLHGRRLRDLADDHRPRLMVVTSDLMTGGILGFTPNGAYSHNVQSLDERTSISGESLDSMFQSEWIPPLSKDVWTEPLAHFVAASGAFPGAFGAVSENLTERPNIERRVLLADGGLTDNTGLTLLMLALNSRKPPDFIPDAEEWHPWQADLVLASDGSRALNDFEEVPSGFHPLQQLSRAADVVYANAGVRFFPSKDAQLPPVFVLTSSELVFRNPAWLRDANPKGLEMLAHGSRKNGLSISDELIAAVEAFQRTATLADVLEPEDARLLFRLGQFMVARRWSGIWFALTRSPDAYQHVVGESSCNLSFDHDAVVACMEGMLTAQAHKTDK